MKFKKITAIAAIGLMGGMLLGNAIALSPSNSPFDAVVYGSQADASDQTQADSIATWLALSEGSSSTTTGGEGETENEVLLGGNVAIGKLASALTDTDIPSLIDSFITWDDGNGNDDLDVHETITLGTTGLQIVTSATNNDYLEPSMIVQEEDISYAYVFDEYINRSGISSSNTITLNILGQEMEFQDITNTTVIVNLAGKRAMGVGETYTDPDTGKTVTVTGIFSTSVGVTVDGVANIISTSATEKVNGLNIYVSDIGYNSNAPETSTSILKIGEQITKTYTDGDAYIGEDKDNPVWVWDISGAYVDTAAKPSIGITLHEDYDSPSEDIVTAGGSYIMPNNFAALSFDSITDAAYEDVTIDFDTSIDLKYSNGTTKRNNAKAIVLTGADKESFKYNSTVESDKVYITYVDYVGGPTVSNYSSFEVYYYDNDDNRAEYVGAGIGNTTSFDVGDFIHDDTTMAIGFRNTAANLTNSTLTFAEDTTIASGADVVIGIGGSSDFEYLGLTTDLAEVGDVRGGTASTVQVGTKDNDVMDYYGTIIKTPDTNADLDKVVLSIPGEPVYAQVSVLTGISTSTSTTGSMVFKDTEKASWQGYDVILVGGSCINTATATALGVSSGTCGADFTTATGVGSGQYLIQTVGNAFTSGKLAMVVAGYEKANTAAAATYLRTNGADIDATAGSKYFGQTSATGTVTVTKV